MGATKFYLRFYEDGQDETPILTLGVPTALMSMLGMYNPGEVVLIERDGRVARFVVTKTPRTIHHQLADGGELKSVLTKIPLRQEDEDPNLDHVPEWWKGLEVDI